MINKYNYEELSPSTKKKLLDNLTTRFIFRGKENPEKSALDCLLQKKAKRKKTWHTLNYRFMLSIDEHRKRLGLEPFFNLKINVDNSVDKTLDL